MDTFYQLLIETPEYGLELLSKYNNLRDGELAKNAVLEALHKVGRSGDCEVHLFLRGVTEE